MLAIFNLYSKDIQVRRATPGVGNVAYSSGETEERKFRVLKSVLIFIGKVRQSGKTTKQGRLFEHEAKVPATATFTLL